jgi:hypothetical protein
MPLLRALAAAALTIAIVQPIVLRPRTTARQGAVVVLVDRSRSMSVVDRDRSPAELVALAGGLGALPPGARQEAAPGLRTRLESIRLLADQLSRAHSEADYAALSGRGAPAAIARVREITERLRTTIDEIALPLPPSVQTSELAQRVDALKAVPPALDDAALRAIRTNVDATARALAQAQAQLDDSVFAGNAYIRELGHQLGRLSRADLVETGLARPNGRGVLAELSAMAPAFGFSFDDDVAPLPWSATARGKDDALDLAPIGSRTDVAAALRGAMQRMGARPVQAIVLITDGRQVGADADGLAADLAAGGVPVFAVSAAAAGARRDVSIVAVDAPASGRVNQLIPVRARVHGSGFPAATSIIVRLDAGNVRQVKDVALNEEGDATAEFDVALTDAGRQSLVVSTAPAAGGADTPEATPENNQFVRWVRVGADPVRVTVLAGGGAAAAARQHATLRDALSRAAWVTLREVDQEDIAAVTPRSILAQDVIILVDVPAEAIARPQWQAMEQLVRERGGSVILCAGQNVPEDYTDDPLTARLLPFGGSQKPGWRTWPGGEPHFRVAPPSPHADDAADETPPDTWRQLPPVSRYVPVPPLGVNARALLVERETGAAVVTETRRGLGRLYFVGTDQTWRWRGPMKPDPREQRDQFWPRLVRLAAGEPFAAVHENLHLDVDDIAPEPQQPVTVRARVLDAYGEPLDAATQMLEIRKPGGEHVRDVTLNSLGEGSGRYQATINDLDAGDYVLHVEAPEDPSTEIPPDPIELPLRVAARYEAELADVSGDDQLLRSIANASGGQFLTLEQLNTLPARLDTIRQRQSRLVEYPLWDSPYLFVLVLACLSTEWALRKKFGLA